MRTKPGTESDYMAGTGTQLYSCIVAQNLGKRSGYRRKEPGGGPNILAVPDFLDDRVLAKSSHWLLTERKVPGPIRNTTRHGFLAFKSGDVDSPWDETSGENRKLSSTCMELNFRLHKYAPNDSDNWLRGQIQLKSNITPKPTFQVCNLRFTTRKPLSRQRKPGPRVHRRLGYLAGRRQSSDSVVPAAVGVQECESSVSQLGVIGS
ncbi:hypothetical protein CHU98_g6619 [Xylaria longipes]|nr:hypothetical protein CHU98_g6619 [Xylaria longipes]